MPGIFINTRAVIGLKPLTYSKTSRSLTAIKQEHFISFVFPQFTSFHSVFHSFHGLMNSINWPASSIWVFIAQLGEHCSANAEATGSNPVEAPKNFFSGYFRNCLHCDSLRWSHTHFFCIPAVHIISFKQEQQEKHFKGKTVFFTVKSLIPLI